MDKASMMGSHDKDFGGKKACTQEKSRNSGQDGEEDGNPMKIVYCEEGPTLAKVVTESFLIYLKIKDSDTKGGHDS